jgi:hypothetical protein
MPSAIDESKLNDAKILDISTPPTKNIPYQPFPKMVYLHPKDKSKEHLTKIVNNHDELDAAIAVGYRAKPHIPSAPPEVFDTATWDVEGDVEPVKRGPGRPPKDAA